MIDTILMAMGGQGQRFKDEGFTDPKPLIKVDNQEMFIKATTCLPEASNYIFITKKEFEKKYNVKKIINHEFSNNKLILMDKPTDGQVSTCLLAKNSIPKDNSLLISPCDSSVIWDKKRFSTQLRDQNLDAIIWTFRNNATVVRNPHMYGWVKTRDGQLANSISCKKSISEDPVNDHAIVGTFWLGSGFKPTPKSILDYFNKSQSQFDDMFNMVADNKRFCLIKSIPNLGSQILKGIRNRAKQDWYDKYNDDLLAIVTTIGADKKGSVYLADNWEFIGITAGLPKERKSFSFKWDQGKEHLKTETGWVDGKDRKRILITSKLKDKISRTTLDEFF